MKHRSVLDVIAEAYQMADAHLAATCGFRPATVSRDVLAIDVFVPVIQVRDDLERKIRKNSKRLKSVEKLAVAVRGEVRAAAAGKGGERRLLEVPEETWRRAINDMNRAGGN